MRSAKARAAEVRCIELMREIREARSALARIETVGEWYDLGHQNEFLALVEAGSGRAAAWLVRHWVVEQGSEREAKFLKLDLYRLLARDFAGAKWLIDPELDPFRSLYADRELFGLEAALDLAGRLRKATPEGPLRAAALMAEAELEVASEDPIVRRAGVKRYEYVRDNYPGTRFPTEAVAALWRFRHLMPGKLAREFVARDVDGNEVRLSDWRRSVVVVQFWSFSDPKTATRIDELSALTDAHRANRFEIIGVHIGNDRDAFRRAAAALDVDWTNVFADPSRNQYVWHVRRTPRNFVIDAKGVLRFIDLEGAELEKAVTKLLRENDQHRASRSSKTEGPPGH